MSLSALTASNHSSLYKAPASTGTANTGSSGSGSFASVLSSTMQTSSSSDAAKTEFLQYARQTPAQRIRTLYLKQHGLTEESLASMGATERQAIERAIKNEIQQKLHMKVERSSALTSDVETVSQS